MEEIGEIICRRRQELRLTQQALADMSGVSVRMLKGIETRTANPSVKTLNKILKPLGLRLGVKERNDMG